MSTPDPRDDLGRLAALHSLRQSGGYKGTTLVLSLLVFAVHGAWRRYSAPADAPAASASASSSRVTRGGEPMVSCSASRSSSRDRASGPPATTGRSRTSTVYGAVADRGGPGGVASEPRRESTR